MTIGELKPVHFQKRPVTAYYAVTGHFDEANGLEAVAQAEIQFAQGFYGCG